MPSTFRPAAFPDANLQFVCISDPQNPARRQQYVISGKSSNARKAIIAKMIWAIHKQLNFSIRAMTEAEIISYGQNSADWAYSTWQNLPDTAD